VQGCGICSDFWCCGKKCLKNFATNEHRKGCVRIQSQVTSEDTKEDEDVEFDVDFEVRDSVSWLG
jgi:hypothetical protein